MVPPQPGRRKGSVLKGRIRDNECLFTRLKRQSFRHPSEAFPRKVTAISAHEKEGLVVPADLVHGKTAHPRFRDYPILSLIV